ncbi:hypothetical protein Pla123a_05250 [Posidoniimonas polymericola]|uniref:Uncharacterized protein n=1 Tax=Posidoniimonas polymericola TaxID=2528002 RepID=A0A5C5ZEX4_9BACT|nr:NfeD family protein [Posidoniimonas polymericola]TWT85718.1 hypothetical protein Pla123a_05250 [Posidoniimonas polymericola]
MFGYLRGPHGDLDYRRAYARCCRFQRLCFGARTAPVVSYEGVFAYLLAREALGGGVLLESESTCCRLRGARAVAGADDQPLGEFAAALGMLLAGIKLRDDVRDDRSLAARLALFIWRRPMKQAEEYFAQLDPAAPSRFREVVERHVALEAAGQRCSLAEFARPTAEGFGYAFSLLSRLDGRLITHADRFEEIGRAIGGAIIMADCAVDWRRDKRRGLPNPVKDADAADDASTAAQRELVEASSCWWAMADRRVSLRVLSSAIERIESRRSAPLPPGKCPTLRPSHLMRAGFCDCDCPIGGCDCGGGDCGGGECGACGGGGPDVGWAPGASAGCCDPSCCICIDCWMCEPRQQKPEMTRRRWESFIGRTGFANGDLAPVGMVVIDGRSHPASTKGPRIGGGACVEVVDVDEFGLIVQRSEQTQA